MDPSERELTAADLCPERPFPHLSACVREVGHDEKCVFAKGSAAGSSLTLYEKGRGHTFRAIYELELEPGTRVSRTEACALLWVAEQHRMRLP
jgi:hypothetical protein